MKKIFRKDLFIKYCDETDDIDSIVNQQCLITWVLDCDGKEVINGYCLDSYMILDEWCEIIEG